MPIKLKDANLNEIESEEEEEIYQVEEILGKKKFGASWKYHIKWEGYGLDQTTWEPIKNLYHVIDMVNDFEENWRNQQTEKEIKKSNKIVERTFKNLQPQSIQEKSSNAVEKPSPAENKKSTKEVVCSFPLLQKKRKFNDAEKEQMIADLQPKRIGLPKLPETNQLIGINYHTSKPKEKSPSNRDINENIVTSISEANGQKPFNKNLFSNEDAIIIADDESVTSKIYGSFESKDVPKRLITAKLVGPNNEVNCKVEWLQRENGIKPADTFLSNTLLREKCPNILLDFYESRLRFPSNPGKQ